MNAGDAFDIILVVLVLAWVLYRQTVARPVTPRQLLVLPAILIVIGINSLSHVDHLGGTAETYVAIDLVSSAALGALRGCFIRVYEQGGVMWRQGTRITIALWIVSIAVRFGIGLLASNAGVGHASDAALEVAFGVSLLAQNAVVAWRGYQRGIPFAPSAARGQGRRRHGRNDGRSFPGGIS